MITNIWEINERYFCPIAGFCLNVEEQWQLLSKNIKKENQKFISKILHDFVIANISKETPIAKQAQKILDKKYSKLIGLYINCNAKEWIEDIDSFLNSQDFGAFIWISAAYIDLSEKDNQQILQKLHMYSHQMYFEYQLSEKKYENIRRQNNIINDKYNGIRSKLKEVEKQLKLLKENYYMLISQNNSLIKENANYSNLKSDNQYLIKQIKEKNHLITQLESDNKQLNKKVNSNSICFENIKQELNEVLSSFKAQQSKCNECDKVDLCQKKVLIVGGITKLESFYKKIVQEMGGLFIYHNGYCRQNESNLSNLVTQSDIVICPVDVNSHAACLQVKKACKKTGTDYYMLRKSSMNSIYNTLLVAANSQ